MEGPEPIVVREPERAERMRHRDRRGQGRRRRAFLWVARVVAVAVVFWIGLLVGRALDEEPRPGGSQTLVRTLEPVTLAPAESTVTVTVP